jgi:hypothetical protein
VAIYSEGLYRSGDLDMVLDRHRRSEVIEVLKEIGFQLYPAEIPVQGRILRLLSPTDCVKDRLAAYIHWNLRDNFRQAVLVARRQKARIDFQNLASWCEREGGAEAYEKLIDELSKTETP